MAQLRMALALAVSAIFHAWLAAGIAVEAPEHSLPSTAHALAAELERVSVPMAAGAKPEREPALADPAAPLPLRAHAPPSTERLLPATKRSEPGAAQGTLAMATTPVLPLPPAVDPTYYSARELDVYPAPQAPLRFEYPERAAHEHVSGSVRIMLLLDEAGAIDGVSVVAAEPPGYFEDRVRAAFAAARFFPARKDGRAVKSRVLINVNYDPAAEEGALR
jgi:protein TonB